MRRFLYVGVFFAGCASLAVELTASRLLGNYFGSSNLVWATIIGLVLIYLSVGYTIGGKWADRSPRFETFFTILLWASFLIGIIPLASRPILSAASAAFDELRVAELIGSFVSVLLLFSIPVTLLGTASPFAIRLAIEEKESSGKTAGRIYALSTLGSFIGTFLPVLVLIPLLGTYRTFVAISLLLMLPAWLGFGFTVSFRSAIRYLWMPAILLIATWIGLRGFDKIADNIIFEGESAYNYIQVQEIDGYRILRLNEGQGIHSIYHPEIKNFNGPWEQVLVSPFFYPPSENPIRVDRIAILGLAAGTSAQQASIVFPDAKIDGFEIDPEIVEVGYDLFSMNGQNINIFIKDARAGLNQSHNSYDIISVDAYKPPYIPWHLTTREFFLEIKNMLSEKGTLVINVARIFDDRRLVDALYQTISTEFPSVYIVDIPESLNSMIFATKNSTNFENLIQNYIVLEDSSTGNPLLMHSLEIAILNQQPVPETGIILTDDHAPIEQITNSMVFDLFFSNQIGKLH
ncbi:MAG: spermine synthase [Chloroflexi bacterium]|nr:spermine synthase [Chloroflexota bacterium]